MNPTLTRRARALVFVSALVFSLFGAVPPTGAADSHTDTEILTQHLVNLGITYHQETPGARSQTLQAMVKAAAQRQERLAALIKQDPAAVLRTAVPEQIRQGMPVEVQPFVEQRLELEGQLEVRIDDFRDGRSEQHYSLASQGEHVSLHFKSPPARLQSGQSVRVGGVRVENSMAVESGESDILVLALDGGADGGSNNGAPAPVANTFGEQSTLVILVNFQDGPIEPYSPDFARDMILGETSDFFFENSYGQTWLSGDVTGWHTIAVNSTGCDGAIIRDHADLAAISAGYDPASYSRLVYAFPQNACGFWGSATVGGNPSRVWLNGDLALELTGHEMGHNLGLEHSHSLLCEDGTSVGPGTAVSGPNPWPNCTRIEYGDGLDIMGWSASGHFNAYQKERLGWLGYGESPGITAINSDGMYEIGPYAAAAGSAPKALKIFKAEDQYGLRTWYFLEYRQAIGFDSIISNSQGDLDPENVLNGVTVHAYWEGGGGYGGYLLDMYPETYDMYEEDPALVMGDTFFAPEGNLTITTDWTDASGAVVAVQFAPSPCSSSNPGVKLSPSTSQWVAAGTPVVYNVTLTNLDTSACADSSFDLSVSGPSNWSTNFSTSLVALAPGESTTADLTVISSATAADGFYDLSIRAENAADSSLADQGTVTYVVSNPVVNQAPIPADDTAGTDQGQAVLINVLLNDTDPDGDPLSLTAFSSGTHGSVTARPDAFLEYLPDNDFVGTDSFDYTVSDGRGGSATATVTVIVSAVVAPPNRAPIAQADEVTLQDKSAVSIDVAANDSDPDGDALNIVSVSQPSKGNVSIESDGTVTYVPARKFKDTDSFSYVISDGLDSASASVTIALQAPTDDGSGGGSGGGKGGGNGGGNGKGKP